jgi:beta-galactosidase
VQTAADQIIVRASHATYTFDLRSGAVLGIDSHGRPLLRSPLRFNFWRPATSNDEGARLPERLLVWREAGESARVDRHELQRDAEGAAVLAFDLTLTATGTRAALRYRVSSDGSLAIETRLDPSPSGTPMMPRIGLTTTLSAAFDQVGWFGKGPHENYSDRQEGAWVGRFSGRVESLFHHYGDPQEAGQRTGVREVTLAQDAGTRLHINATGPDLLEFSVYPGLAEDLELARHPIDLPPRDVVTLNLDHRQMGLGGTNSWGALPLERHQLPSNRAYEFSLLLLPQP